MSLWNQQRSEKKKKERKGGEGGREHDPLQGEAVRGVVVCGGRCFFPLLESGSVLGKREMAR